MVCPVLGDAVRAMLADRAPQGLDWVFLNPTGGYGAWAARASREGYSSMTSSPAPALSSAAMCLAEGVLVHPPSPS